MGQRRLDVRLRDVLLAVALAAAMVFEVWVKDGTDLTPLTVALIGAAATPVVFRRVQPAVALIAAMALLYAVLAVAPCPETVPFPSMVCGYQLALVTTRRSTIAVGVVLVPAVLGALVLFNEEGVLDPEVPRNLAYVAVPLLAGAAVRNRRAYASALLDRAESAERRSEERALRRVAEERLRIARDVHDVVAHAMVAINVQAGVAAHLMPRDPGRAKSSLLDIKRVSGRALDDLRATLRVLREDGREPTRPAHRLSELESLVAEARSGGADVTLTVDPELHDLPEMLDLTIYRIVQEGLTNAMRHAPGASIQVRVVRSARTVIVEVLDDGKATGRHGDGPPGSGHGLRGMTERVTALGGQADAGPLPDGGWQVRAELPLSHTESTVTR